MKIEFKKYPIDIILCLGCSIFLIPFALFDISNIFRILFGLPFILFIPGYLLIFSLFPTKKEFGKIDMIQRIALGFGFSIVIVSLFGLILNFTTFQIRLTPILIGLFFIIIFLGLISLIRWIKTPIDKRLILSLNLSFIKSNNSTDKILKIIACISIIIAVASIIYVIIIPKIGPSFTEFFILDEEGDTTNYTRNLKIGENSTINIGLINYEHKIMNYTIEVWLIDQDNFYNLSTNEYDTIYNHMWFMDKITIAIYHATTDINKLEKSKWLYNYNFSINRVGNFKLTFFLFIEPTIEYIRDGDYRYLAEQKIKDAYREVHLWLNVE